MIYLAINKVNGKMYIGKTKNPLEERIKQHYRDSKKLDLYFYRAARKYGWENFEWHVLDTSQDNLNILEKHYIDYFKSYYYGYNSTIGGEGPIGPLLYKRTKEHSLNISKAKKGKPCPTKGMKRKSEPLELRKLKSKPVICNETHVVYYSCRECCRQLNIAQRNLSSHLNKGTPKTLSNLTFKWVDQRGSNSYS